MEWYPKTNEEREQILELVKLAYQQGVRDTVLQSYKKINPWEHMVPEVKDDSEN